MSQVKDYNCRNCGSSLEFATGSTDTYCVFCGIQNIIGEIDSLDSVIEKEFNDRFGAIMKQLHATGDPETRAYLFSRDLQPKLDAQVQELEEKFEEKFRYPLIQVNALAKADRLYNVSNALINKAWDSNDMQSIVKFYSRELKLPLFKVMAQTEQLERSLSKLELRSQHIANIYFIRGYSINFNDENLTKMNRFLIRAIETVTNILKYPIDNKEDKLESSRVIMYLFWQKRFKIYQKFVETLQMALKEKDPSLKGKFLELATNCDEAISELKSAGVPLFLSIPFMEGFSGDKSIFSYFAIITDLCETFDGKFSFKDVYNLVEDYIFDITGKFDAISTIPNWDTTWIEKVSEPLQIIFNLIASFKTAIQIQNGKTSCTYYSKGFSFSDPYVVSDNSTCKPRNDEILVRQKVNVYVPIALASTYSILTKGFLWMKAGEDFDGNLLVNTLFNQDTFVSRGLYVNAVSMLDFSLKEKDKERIRIDGFLSSYENTTPCQEALAETILPQSTTNEQIETFISKSYELFEMSQTSKIEPINNFNKAYKQCKFEKNLERLNGELMDILYVPLSLILVARGKMKKGAFKPKEQFHWKAISPFPLEDNRKRDPEDFLGIKFDAAALIQGHEFMKKVNS